MGVVKHFFIKFPDEKPMQYTVIIDIFINSGMWDLWYEMWVETENYRIQGKTENSGVRLE